MKIRMLHQRTGGRYDGQDWPERGGEIDVPDSEAQFLCERGMAEIVETKPVAPRAKAAKPTTG